MLRHYLRRLPVNAEIEWQLCARCEHRPVPSACTHHSHASSQNTAHCLAAPLALIHIEPLGRPCDNVDARTISSNQYRQAILHDMLKIVMMASGTRVLYEHIAW